MNQTETVQLIDRLRRDMPRNGNVMALCEAYEELMAKVQPAKQPLTRAEIQKNYRLRKKAGQGEMS